MARRDQTEIGSRGDGPEDEPVDAESGRQRADRQRADPPNVDRQRSDQQQGRNRPLRRERPRADQGAADQQRADSGPRTKERPRADQPVGDRPDGADQADPSPETAHGTRTSDAADAAAKPPPTPPPPTRSWFQVQRDSFVRIAEQIHLGALATGVAIIVLGVLLLGGTQIAWRGLLDAVLVVVGLALVLGSRRPDGRRALVVVGLLLAVIMLGVWRADVPLRGGMRWHTVTPTTPAALTSPYHQTAGSLTIDLTRYPRPPASTPPAPLVASIGVGRLVVIVPAFTFLQGTIAVGEGRVSVLGADKNGVGLEVPLAAANVPALARADLRVGTGTVEVQVGKSP